MALVDEYVVKLVRDRVGDHVGPPRDFYYRPVEDRETHVKLLREKLGEEVIEYLLDPSVGEAADILQALIDVTVVDLGASWIEVEEAAERKALERGTFREGTVMVARAFEDDPDA